jgi:hypothetical protein
MLLGSFVIIFTTLKGFNLHSEIGNHVTDTALFPNLDSNKRSAPQLDINMEVKPPDTDTVFPAIKIP